MKKCPKCNCNLIEIVYGLPTDEASDKAMFGELYLGGCIITDDQPALYCSLCNLGYSEDLSKTYNMDDDEEDEDYDDEDGESSADGEADA